MYVYDHSSRERKWEDLASKDLFEFQAKQVLIIMIFPQEEDSRVESFGVNLAQNSKKRKHDKHVEDEEGKNVPKTVSVDESEHELRSPKRQRIDTEAQSIDGGLQSSASGLFQRDFQAALLNFIATCPVASDGVINVSYDRFEFDLLQELSKETLHDYDDFSFVAKINYKASYLNLERVKNLKKVDIRDVIQSSFQNAFMDLLKIVRTFEESSVFFTKESVLSIITSVTSNIILSEKIFISKDAERKFDDFFENLERKIRKIIKKQNVYKKQSKARKCAAWIEYRMMFADKFLSETLIGCNAASLLLSSLILLLAGCDFPIFLCRFDYFLKFSVKDPELDANIDHINKKFETLYLEKFKKDEKFQPNHFTRKLKTDASEDELLSYYRSVILDNMLILLESSSPMKLDTIPSNVSTLSLDRGIRKNASHYKSVFDVMPLILVEVKKLQEKPDVSSENIRNIIERIISHIHGVHIGRDMEKVLRRADSKTSTTATTPSQLYTRYEESFTFIAERIVNYHKYDIIETLARIDYDVSVRHQFFRDGNARIAQAIVVFLCAYFGMAAPEIVEGDHKQRFLSRSSVIEIDLNDETVFQFWYKYYTTLFAPNKETIPSSDQNHSSHEHTAQFSDGWSVLWENLVEAEETIYKEGMRSPYEMTLLKRATGYDMKQLVVFRPERMMFHKFVVYLVTNYRISSNVLLEMKEPFLKLDVVQRFRSDMTKKFEQMRKEYEVYLDQCYFDDPLELNREPTLHAFIEKVRGTIRGRITSGKCQISPSQARKIMRMLVVDELLREYFEPKINSFVEDCFERIRYHPCSEDELEVARFLTPLSVLEFRENDFQRVSWAVVGGPAAGKSTLKRELKIKAPVCEINPDDYKLLLYSEGSKNASLVHEESSFIVDQIMKALKAMPKRPDVLLDVVKSSEDKMDILAKGGATLYLIIATCDAEEAINRAYNRATSSKNLEDRGRFVPTKEILLGHKKESLILPAVIRKYRINLDLFDTSNPGEPILIAQLETKRNELKIFRLSLFLKFIRKALINEYATHKDQVYLYPFDGKAMYKEFMKYIDEGVTLSFINEGALYCKIDPSTGLTCRHGWCERFIHEFEEGGFRYSVLEDLLLYFAYPHYCNGLLIEVPGKQINLLDIELSENMVVRNQESNNELRAKESFRDLFPKLCGSYPTIRLIEPTPIREIKVQGSEMIDIIRGKDSNLNEVLSEEGRAELLAEALLRLEAKRFEELMESLKIIRNFHYYDDIQKIIDKALLSFRIFPLAKRLLLDPDLASYASVWIPETIRSMLVPNSCALEIINVRWNTSLKLSDTNSNVGFGSEDNNDARFFWRFKLIDDEYFLIFVSNRDNEPLHLKLGFKQKDYDRIVKGDKFDSSDVERFQWQLIPVEGGKSFLIINTARKVYLRLGEEIISTGGRRVEASQGIRNQNDDFVWRLTLHEAREETEEPQSSLLKLFVDSSLSEDQTSTFLSEIASRFPELKYYGTLCDATPDLAVDIPSPPKSLVDAVFGAEEVQSWINKNEREGYTKIAAINRCLLRLIYLRSLMRHDRKYFPLIAPERLNYISKNLVVLCCQDEETFTFLVLSIILDALGRTEVIRNEIAKLRINPDHGHEFHYGHDEYWRSFINHFKHSKGKRRKSFDSLIPSFKKLSKENQDLYYSNIATNTFNLGAFVQGESVPYCLHELFQERQDCRIRLLVLLISFLPIQFNDKFEAVGFTNAMYDQFTTALTVITEAKLNEGDEVEKFSCEAYKKYLRLNAQMVGVPAEIPAKDEKETLALHRIVALSRSRFPIHWRKVWFVWRKLPQKVKNKLIHYMTVTGFEEGHVSIYIYYAPAIISNTMKAAQKLAEFSVEQVLEHMFDQDAWTVGLYYGLIKLTEIYEKVHRDKLPKLLEKKSYYIYYGKADADEASKMKTFCAESLTSPTARRDVHRYFTKPTL